MPDFEQPPEEPKMEEEIDWETLREIAADVLFGQSAAKNLSELRDQLNTQAQSKGINPERLESEFLLALKEWSAPSFEDLPGH